MLLVAFLSFSHISTYEPKSPQFGQALEHFIALELRAYFSYRKRRLSLQYWRTQSSFEVDFIIDPELALEIKSTDLVKDKHLKGLRALREEGKLKRYGVVSLDPEYRITSDDIHIWPVALFLKKLWSDEIF